MSSLNKKIDWLKLYPYAAGGLLTAAIILIVYAVNGIFPFGTGSVVCDDMVQQTISNYTYFWDYLHSGGDKSLLFNWQTAAGAQVLTTGFYILKPWEIIFTLLCPRDGIVDGIPFLIIFKMTMATLSMIYFVRKEFRVNPFWQVFLGISYSCSSFILVYYTNMGWIDAAFMFPFLIVALLHMFRTGKWLPYFLMLTYTLLLSIYISYMVFLFLFFVGFLYLAIVQPKETRKMSIIRFGVTSVISIAASAVINVPSIYYMFRSTRYSIKSEETALDSILKIFNTDTTYSTTKLMIVMLCSAVFFAFLIMMFVNFKEHKKACAFFGLSVLFLAAPVFFENINLIWHLGSYVGFPLRYAYMLIFMLVCMAAYVLTNMPDVVHSIKGKKSLVIVIPAVVCAVAGICLLVTRVYNEVTTVSGLKYRKLLITDCDVWIFASFILLALFYVMILFVGYKKIAYILMSCVMLTEIGLLANVSFGMNSNTEDRSAMYSLDFVTDSLEMAEDLKLENDNLSRIKDMDVRLNSNFPMFFEYPSLANFTHLVSSDMTSTMEALGYSQVYTRVIDSVGTLLADALLNMKHTFSEKELDSFEYTYLYDIGDSHLYENNMTLPFGLIVDDEFMNIDIVENNDVFLSNNQLYTALTGDKSELCTTQNFTMDCYKGSEEMFTIRVGEKRHLYLHIDVENSVENRGSLFVFINNELADLSYFGDDSNYPYPNNFQNELIDLGVRENEEIRIVISCSKNVGDDVKITVGSFDYTKLQTLCGMNKDNHAVVETGPKSLTATVENGKAGTYVFLPVTYDEGWSCKVNGEKKDIAIAMSSFMAVELEEGENVIEMSYLPHGMKLGIIITVITGIAVAGIYLIEKKKPFSQEASNAFLKIFEKVYLFGMLCAVGIVYLIPVIFTAYNNIVG